MIWVQPLRENFIAGAAAPTIKLKMEPADAGDMPLVKVGLTIPKAGLKDESELDLNQLRLFDEVTE